MFQQRIVHLLESDEKWEVGQCSARRCIISRCTSGSLVSSMISLTKCATIPIHTTGFSATSLSTTQKPKTLLRANPKDDPPIGRHLR
jgi:hypothetical protein